MGPPGVCDGSLRRGRLPAAGACAFLALWLVAATGCAPDEAADRSRTVHAGSTWFDWIDRLEVCDYPVSSLSEDVEAFLGRRVRSRRVTFPAGAWRRLRSVPSEWKKFFNLAGESSYWELTSGYQLESAPRAPRLLHAGREMTAVTGPAAMGDPTGRRVWWDKPAQLVVFWRPRGQ